MEEVNIGAVKKETPAQNLGCHEYEGISLSDPKMVQLLIKYRQEIYPRDYLSQGFKFKELLTCIYIDLDRLVKESPLSNGERVVVELLMNGYSINDVAETRNIKYHTVIVLLQRACEKIANLNNAKWLEYMKRCYGVKP